LHDGRLLLKVDENYLPVAACEGNGAFVPTRRGQVPGKNVLAFVTECFLHICGDTVAMFLGSEFRRRKFCAVNDGDVTL